MDVIEEQFRMAEEQIEMLRKMSEEVNSQASSVMKVALDWRILQDHFTSLQNSLREQAKKIECWSERVEIKSKMVEERFSQVETRERESKVVWKQIEDCTQKLKLRELQLDAHKNEAEVLDKKTQERKRKLSLVEKELEGCNRELATKQKQWSEVQKTLEAYNREVESKERRLGLAQMTTCESIKMLDDCEKLLSDKRQQLCQVENLLEGRNAELGNAERQLLLIQKTMEESLNMLAGGGDVLDARNERLGVVQQLIKVCEADLENKERIIGDAIKDCNREFNVREKRLELVHKSIVDYSVQLLKIEQFIKESSGNVESEMDHLDSIKVQVRKKTKQLEDCSRELDGKEKRLEFVQKSTEECAELLRIQDSIKECSGNLKTEMDCLDSIKAQVQQQTEQLEAVERQYEDMQKLASALSVKVKSKEKDLQSIERLSNENSEMLRSKEKQVEEVKLLIKQCEAEFEEKRQKLKSLKQIEVMPERNAFTSSANVLSTVATDDTSLLPIISDGIHNIWSMKSIVSQTVLDLQEPAKMVLNMLTRVGFSASGIRARCLFLEKLMQLSPQVSSNVKEESIPLAVRWRSCFTLEDENPMEVLAFLSFLIVYGVASFFRERDILDLIMIIAEHKQAPEICGKLGFTERMPEFVGLLIQKKKHMEAAKFICSFGLATEFPTEPLLKRYLENRRMEAWISRCELNSLEDVDWFMDRELEALRAISSFIKEFKLDFGSVAQRISDEIVKLEYDRASRMLCAPATTVHSVSHHAQGLNYHHSGDISGFTNAHANPPPRFQPQLQSQLQQHQKRPRMSASQASSQANLYDGAPYFDAAFGTPANYWQSSDYVTPGDISRPPNKMWEPHSFVTREEGIPIIASYRDFSRCSKNINSN